jgi:hypothetical protein
VERALLSSVGITVLWVLAQVAWMHVRPARSRFKAMCAGFLLSLPALAWALGDSAAADAAQAALLHLLLFFFYVQCFYHVERSVTLRLLVEIHRAPGGKIPLAQLMKSYSFEDMVRERLGTLGENGFLARDGDRWRNTPKGRLFARVMALSEWVFQSRGQSRS